MSKAINSETDISEIVIQCPWYVYYGGYYRTRSSRNWQRLIPAIYQCLYKVIYRSLLELRARWRQFFYVSNSRSNCSTNSRLEKRGWHKIDLVPNNAKERKVEKALSNSFSLALTSLIGKA